VQKEDGTRRGAAEGCEKAVKVETDGSFIIIGVVDRLDAYVSEDGVMVG